MKRHEYMLSDECTINLVDFENLISPSENITIQQLLNDTQFLDIREEFQLRCSLIEKRSDEIPSSTFKFFKEKPKDDMQNSDRKSQQEQGFELKK